MNSQVLTVSNLDFQYPSQELSLADRPLLPQVSLLLPPATILHIRGPNGCGKTTLLKLLAGILQPDAGDIGYGKHSIWADLAAYQQNITYLGHKLGYNSNLTIWEHAHLDWDLSADPARLVQILHEFKLWAIKDRVCAQLSAGQKRRVSLLRLGLAATSLWLLDEPLVTLDQEGVTVLMRRIQQHVAQGGQVIYTSHQPLPAHQMAHHEYELCKR